MKSKKVIFTIAIAISAPILNIVAFYIQDLEYKNLFVDYLGETVIFGVSLILVAYWVFYVKSIKNNELIEELKQEKEILQEEKDSYKDELTKIIEDMDEAKIYMAAKRFKEDPDV